jgi:hypothetical protein
MAIETQRFLCLFRADWEVAKWLSDTAVVAFVGIAVKNFISRSVDRHGNSVVKMQNIPNIHEIGGAGKAG